MSRNYGGNRAGHSRHDHHAQNSESGDHERRGGRGRGRGHPPGLKGREIGMYYRNLKTKEEPKEHYFSLDSHVEEEVRCLLFRLKTPNVQESESSDEEIDHLTGKYSHIKDLNFKKKFLNIVLGSIQENLARALLVKSKLEKNAKNDEILMDEQANRESRPEYQEMLKFRKQLPSYNLKDEIIDLINENQVVVISGETGCGKTTQVAQFILDDEIARGRGSTVKIVCSQPRRISAISVAERVAAERSEDLGTSVGFQIRLEKVMCRDYGSILFCTTGLLLQYMQGDPALRDFSHIILDEIHERNTESDFLITLLKQVIPKRPDLKVILMSATLNSESFSRYYDNCPIFHIPGFTYPVREYYLEDILEITRFSFPLPQPIPNNYKKYTKKFKAMREEMDAFSELMKPSVEHLEDYHKYPSYVTEQLKNPNSEQLSVELIQELIRHISAHKRPGAILVFLPGLMDIVKLNKALLDSGDFPSSKFVIYPLHSRLPTTEQRLIFKRPPNGVRKIIIATSIAESSITIEDVVYVIDCGRTKLTRFDTTKNLETLEPEWISLANARQRRGRAGRVQEGECYKLFTRARERTFDQYPTPEMLRTPLEQVILQAKILQLGRVGVFLGSVMDPPDDKAIQLALNLLTSLNALDDDEHLTPLGYHLAKLPLDPRTGKMILWAAMFSCVEPVFAIAASLAFKDAFYCPLGKEDAANRAKLELGLGHYSDHIALAEALRQYEIALGDGTAGRFCYENFLSRSTLKLLSEMKSQFTKHLYEMNFLESADPSDRRSNKNSRNFSLIKAIVCAGLFPNVAMVKNCKHYPRLKTPEDGTVKIHPSSINARAKSLPTSFATYYLKQKSTAIYLHDVTCVDEMALIFAAPKSCIRKQKSRSLIVLNDSISFLCKQSTAELVMRLKKDMDELLEHKISHPDTIKSHSREDLVIRAILRILSADDYDGDLEHDGMWRPLSENW